MLALIAETSFTEHAVSFPDFSPEISIRTSPILLMSDVPIRKIEQRR